MGFAKATRRRGETRFKLTWYHRQLPFRAYINDENALAQDRLVEELRVLPVLDRSFRKKYAKRHIDACAGFEVPTILLIKALLL
jgi:hypothetical protein